MKYLLRFLLFTFIAFIIYGYFLKNSGSTDGDKWVGVGVLIMALVLMPLFIYHRYKNKNVKDYLLNNFTENNENAENQ